jgi:hypothetical protein
LPPSSFDVTRGFQTQLGIVAFSPGRKTGPLGSGERRKISRKLGAAEDGRATSTEASSTAHVANAQATTAIAQGRSRREDARAIATVLHDPRMHAQGQSVQGLSIWNEAGVDITLPIYAQML